MSNAPQSGQFIGVDALARKPDAHVLVVDAITHAECVEMFPQFAVIGVKGEPKPHEGLTGRTVLVWTVYPQKAIGGIPSDNIGIITGDRVPATFLSNPAAGFAYARSHIQRHVPTAEPVRDAPAPVREAAEATNGRAVTLKGNKVRRDVENPSWDTLGLVLTDKGIPVTCLDNCIRALERGPLAGNLWYDTFLQRILHTWDRDEAIEWADHDDVRLALYLQREVGIPRVSRSLAGDAALGYAMREKRNCAFDWLDGLQWDHTERLGLLACLGFGTAPEDEYAAAVCRNMMLAMVKRVFWPGCKSDYMPIFEGTQGVGKSKALAILGGAWFAESHESILSKDFYGVLDGKMLVEISEMHAFKQADVDRIKGTVSCPVDRYRVSYGRHTTDHPRQCVIAGTTNRDDWNRDDTGARRFWPIKCGAIDHAWLTANREQLFAEAVYCIRRGDSHWEVPWVDAEREQDDRRQVDTWEEEFEQYIKHSPSRDLDGATRWTRRGEPLTDCRVSEFLTDGLGIVPARISRGDEMRAAKAMKACGWIRVRTNEQGKRTWVYRPGSTQK